MIALALVFSLNARAAQVCNVCLDTPAPVEKLKTGKGGSSDGKPHTEKLDKPLFTGDLFYSLDNAEKVPLPTGKGVFFTSNDMGMHGLRILSATGKNWGMVRFHCSEYPNGSRINYAPSGFYSPGWKTTPLPKDPKKCPWHPEHG